MIPIAAPVSPKRYAMSLGVGRSEAGIGIAPTRIAPNNAAHHSGIRGSIANTCSRLPIPRSNSTRALSRAKREPDQPQTARRRARHNHPPKRARRHQDRSSPTIDDVAHSVEALRHLDRSQLVRYPDPPSGNAITVGTKKRHDRRLAPLRQPIRVIARTTTPRAAAGSRDRACASHRTCWTRSEAEQNAAGSRRRSTPCRRLVRLHLRNPGSRLNQWVVGTPWRYRERSAGDRRPRASHSALELRGRRLRVPVWPHHEARHPRSSRD